MTTIILPGPALCVILVMVSIMAGSVTGVSLWSRIKQSLNMDDSALFKREMGSHHPTDMDGDHDHMDMQGDHDHMGMEGGQGGQMDIQGDHGGHNGLEELHDHKHGIKMGIPNQKCDDGEHGISTDWDPSDHSVLECEFGEFEALDRDSEPVLINGTSPKYVQHVCLKTSIQYPTPIPTSGNHRPLWPKFGEYVYLPPQRWVHSLEHGAVALLYHPCMNGSSELKILKLLLKHCLTKYVITPYRLIPNNMDYALKGPETHVLKDGQYDIRKIHGVSEVTNDVTCHDGFLQIIKKIFDLIDFP